MTTESHPLNAAIRDAIAIPTRLKIVRSSSRTVKDYLEDIAPQDNIMKDNWVLYNSRKLKVHSLGSKELNNLCEAINQTEAEA